MHNFIPLLRRHAWIFLFPLLLSLGVGLYWLFQPDEYLAQVEFIPPEFELLTHPKYPQHAPGKAADLERLYGYLSAEYTHLLIAEELDLIRNYQIDTTLPTSNRITKLLLQIRDHIEVKITPNSTIMVQVYDKNPSFARKVAETYLEKAETFCQTMSRLQDALHETKAQLTSVENNLKDLEKRLSSLRTQYRIWLPVRTENTPTLPTLSAQSAEAYDAVLSLETRLIELQKVYAEVIGTYWQQERFIRSNPKLIILIQPPRTPDVPKRPRRLLIFLSTLVGSIAVTLFFLVYAYRLGLLGKELYREPVPLQA
ncbi:MAG: hypothetical protein ACUVRD_07875 [Bacteroidia bacterium]